MQNNIQQVSLFIIIILMLLNIVIGKLTICKYDSNNTNSWTPNFHEIPMLIEIKHFLILKSAYTIGYTYSTTWYHKLSCSVENVWCVSFIVFRVLQLQFSVRKRQVGLLHCISVSSVCPHGSPQRENEPNLLRPTITARNDCVVGPHNNISKHMFDHWLCCPPTHWEPAAPPPPMQHFYCLVRLWAQCCQQNLVYPTNEGCNQAQVTPTSALLGRIRILSHIKTVCSTKAKLGVTFLGVQKTHENNKKAWKIYPHQRVTPSSECH